MKPSSARSSRIFCPGTRQGHQFGFAAAGTAGKLNGHFGSVPEMHGHQQPRLHFHDEIVGTGIEQPPMPGIHREEGHINAVIPQGLTGLVEGSLMGINLLDSADLPPVPEVQITGIDNPQPSRFPCKWHNKKAV